VTEPANGIAIVTMLDVDSPPAMFIVMVVGASAAVDIFSPI
jgi:ATP-dependent protease ClpP protease subunit